MKTISPSVNRNVLKFFLVAALGFAGPCRTVSAAAVTLTGSDASNTSSFDAAGNWSDGLAPSAGNDYFVSSGFALRTPTTSYVSYTFQGNSLTLNGNATLAWKLALGSPSITVNDLRLDNGTFSNSNNNYTATLNGNVTLNAGGGTFDTPSPDRFMVVNAQVSGTGNLTVKSSVGAGGNTTLTNANNSYTGNTVVSTGAIMNIGSAGRLGSGSYAGTITNSGAFVYKSSANQILSGIISGNGTLTQSGTGTLTLSGANAYTGATTVNSGMLTLNRQTGSLAAASALTMGGGTFNMDNIGATTALNQSLGALTPSAGDSTVRTTRTVGYDQALTFSSLGTRAAGATLNFVNGGGTNSATNGFNLTGVTAGYINQGTFYGGSNYAWMNATGTFVRGIAYASDTGAESISASTAAFTAGKLYEQVTGSGAITAQTTQTINTLNLDNANNFVLAGGATLTVNGILKSGNAAGGTISGGTGIQAASGTELVVRTDTASDTLAISTPILANGASSLTKSGAGTLRLSSANTYTGNTTVNGGLIQLNVAETAGTSGPLGNPATLASSIVLQAGGLQFTTNNTYDYTTSSRLKLADASTGTIDTNGQNVTFANAIGVGSAKTGALTKAGAGTLTLSAANTYTGATTVSAGVLKAGIANAFGTNSAVTLANTSGVTLDITGFATSIGSLTGGGTTGGNVTLGAVTLTTGGDNTSPAAYAGVISGTGALTKTGSGTQILSGANTYTGLTTVSVGVLNIQSNTATGTTAGGVSVTDGAALQIQNNITVGAEALTLNGNGISTTGALRNISGANVWQGTVTLGSAARINSDVGGSLTFNTAANSITGTNKGLTLGGAGNGTVGGTITTGTGTLTKDGAGTWTLGGTNTYTGLTTVNLGELDLNNASGLSIAGNLTVSGGTVKLLQASQIATGATVTVSSGSFNTNNLAQTVSAFNMSGGSLDGGGTITATTYGLSGGTVTANLGAGTANVTGTVALSGTMVPTTLNVNSGGTLTLGSSNRMGDSSAVTVNAGTLAMGRCGRKNKMPACRAAADFGKI